MDATIQDSTVKSRKGLSDGKSFQEKSIVFDQYFFCMNYEAVLFIHHFYLCFTWGGGGSRLKY